MEKEFELDDPYEMVGVMIPSPPGEDLTSEMVKVFMEEYAVLGFSRERIMRLFENPFYAGVHAVYQQRGEAFVNGIADQIFGPSREARNG